MKTSRAVFTVITKDYLPYALALRDSLRETISDFDFIVFISEDGLDTLDIEDALILYPKDFVNFNYGNLIYQKYHNTQIDSYRWSMKPVIMSYLLSQMNYEKCFYVDCDIHFYNSSEFLFKLLDKYAVLLSPHNRSLYPKNDLSNFEKNFKEGIYNGGFVAANKDGIEAMNWWAECCYFNCVKDINNGRYVDQKYLDLMPARFKNVTSISHLGCNVAEWNFTDCKRVYVNNDVYINAEYPIIFIHFSSVLPENILFGQDKLLLEYFNKFSDSIKKYNPNFDLKAMTIRRHEEKYEMINSDISLSSSHFEENEIDYNLARRFFNKLKRRFGNI